MIEHIDLIVCWKNDCPNTSRCKLSLKAQVSIGIAIQKFDRGEITSCVLRLTLGLISLVAKTDRFHFVGIRFCGVVLYILTASIGFGWSMPRRLNKRRHLHTSFSSIRSVYNANKHVDLLPCRLLKNCSSPFIPTSPRLPAVSNSTINCSGNETNSVLLVHLNAWLLRRITQPDHGLSSLSYRWSIKCDSRLPMQPLWYKNGLAAWVKKVKNTSVLFFDCFFKRIMPIW